MRRETKMQGRALDEYRPGETTQAEVAARFGITQSALAHRLRRFRNRNGIRRRPPRPKHYRIIRPIQLSALTNV